MRSCAESVCAQCACVKCSCDFTRSHTNISHTHTAHTHSQHKTSHSSPCKYFPIVFELRLIPPVPISIPGHLFPDCFHANILMPILLFFSQHFPVASMACQHLLFFATFSCQFSQHLVFRIPKVSALLLQHSPPPPGGTNISP